MADCSCAFDDLIPDWTTATACAGPGWCADSGWVRWSNGSRFLKVRAPIGLEFHQSGVADLGDGLYAIGCHPSLMHRGDPVLLCILELHPEVGLLRIDRVLPVPSAEQASIPALANWSANREPDQVLVGGRVQDDLIVAFADSLARVSLREWAPEPPVVCTWGTDYCSNGSVQGTGLLVRDDDHYAVELVCESMAAEHGPVTRQEYCATCSLPAYGTRGAEEPASLEAGGCDQTPPS